MNQDGKIYLIGGGIAALAAAAFAIRDGHVRGERIHLFDKNDIPGGSLDGSGNPDNGYMMRGGRMFEAHFGCTFDLLRSIPALSDSSRTVFDEIRDFTHQIITSSRCRLIINRERQEAPAFGLTLRQRWDLVRLTMTAETRLADRRICDHFDEDFFTSGFWLMWCTMFAFQPWHSLAEMRRYLRRFMHMLPGFNRLEGIWRTPLNQYDSVIRPLCAWLVAQGVHLHLAHEVTDVQFKRVGSNIEAKRIAMTTSEGSSGVELAAGDVVMITLGSMTDASSLGSMTQPARRETDPHAPVWSLWRRISRQAETFGRPEAFAGNIDQSRWTSFTATLRDPYFFDWMETFTGNRAGTGGLVTFPQSNWLLSIVLAHQPHFDGQPQDVQVFWGYSLRPARHGNYVDKPMDDCNGREILIELCGHLGIEDSDRVLEFATCRPCSMPYITSQFMPRNVADRPAVIPQGATNFAFLGQFTEVPEGDTVFTVEYSVRTAQMAVYQLLRIARPVTPMYQGFRRPGVLWRAVLKLASG